VQLVGPQLVKKYPTFYGPPKVHYCVHEACQKTTLFLNVNNPFHSWHGVKYPKMRIFKITVHISPHIIIGIITTKYIANIIRTAANLSKFALSSFEITYKMVVLTSQLVCVIYIFNNCFFNDAVLPGLVL